MSIAIATELAPQCTVTHSTMRTVAISSIVAVLVPLVSLGPCAQFKNADFWFQTNELPMPVPSSHRLFEKI